MFMKVHYTVEWIAGVQNEALAKNKRRPLAFRTADSGSKLQAAPVRALALQPLFLEEEMATALLWCWMLEAGPMAHRIAVTPLLGGRSFQAPGIMDNSCWVARRGRRQNIQPLRSPLVGVVRADSHHQRLAWTTCLCKRRWIFVLIMAAGWWAALGVGAALLQQRVMMIAAARVLIKFKAEDSRALAGPATLAPGTSA